MKFYIALALIGFVAADVSHLQLGNAAGYSYGSASVSSSSSANLPGGDASSYQPEHLIPQHLKTAEVESASAQVIPGGDSNSYQPEHLIPQHLRTAHVESASAQVIPGADSSSYQPEHLIPQHLRTAHVESAYAQVIPGADSSSYQPEHLIPQHLKAVHVESASAEVIPGGDSSSYQPEHLIPQNLRTESASVEVNAESFNLGRDTQTPEQYIPEADRVAHYEYIQSQGKLVSPVESTSVEVIPGSDSNSYQPEHLIPQHLKAVHVESVSAEVIAGGDSSSYQPEHLIPQNLRSESGSASAEVNQESFNLGRDIQTPEQFIPEADRIAHYEYIHSQGKAVAPVESASAEVIPGGDSSSYQPEQLIPQQLRVAQVETESINLGANPQTPEQYIPPAVRVAHANYGQQQAPVIIGANTITPAHLYQEQVSNGIEEFNAETHVPIAIGRDTITPAHLLPKYSAGASASASSSSHGTQYASNGGYVY